MGGPNRSYPSLEWVGLDYERIVRQNVLCEARWGLVLSSVSPNERRSFASQAGPGQAVRWSVRFDSPKRAGIPCRAGLIFFVDSAKEECDVAGDALKVEDATWDADVMKASELVMVDFWAVWCGPCQMVAPIIEELAKEYAGKVKVRKLNTDENPEVAGRYQVMSIPTILFFKNGQVVEKLVGARPKRQFKEMIDSLLAQPAGSA